MKNFENKKLKFCSYNINSIRYTKPRKIKNKEKILKR